MTSKSIHPTMKTYEDFLQNYEKEPESVKKQLYKNYLFATKEVERKKAQYQRRKQRKHAEIAALPEHQRPKVGRPKKKTIEDYQKELEDLKLQLAQHQQQQLVIPEAPAPAPAPEAAPVSDKGHHYTTAVADAKQLYGNVITNTKVKKLTK